MIARAWRGRMRACHLGSTELRCADETQCGHVRSGANSARALTEPCNDLRRSSMGGCRVARSATPRVWQRGDERLAAGSRAAGADVIDAACWQSERFRRAVERVLGAARSAIAGERDLKSFHTPGMK